MGRSHKKVKSDRINALRKQYDEFLEEDKKRKERNDYIIGRLDKMRLSTTILPLRYKVNSLIESHGDVGIINENINSAENTKANKKDQLLPFNSSTNILNENLILKEISKKYILIPKLKQVENNNNTRLHITASPQDSDWKSKYDILDKLKEEEKEILTYNNPHENNINNVLIDKDKQLIQQSQSQIYHDEIPEKDLTIENSQINLEKEETTPIIKDEIETEGVILENKNYINIDVDNEVTYNDMEKQTENNNYSNTDINTYTNNSENLNQNSQYQVYSEGQNDVYMQNNSDNPNITAGNTKEENGAYKEIDYENYEGSNNTEHERQKNIYSDQVPTSTGNFVEETNNSAEANELLINNNEGLESMLNEDLSGQDSTAKDHIQLIPDEPTTIQVTEEHSSNDEKNETTYPIEFQENGETSIQQEFHIEVSAENPIVSSDKEVFETEQKEMYYSEQGDYNYGTYNENDSTYNQNDGTYNQNNGTYNQINGTYNQNDGTYNQNNDTYNQNDGTYNQNQTYDAEYTENDNQELTEQYSYYNKEQPEAYPVEANDHEATYQQYDQTYEQQFGSTPQAEQDLQETIHYDPESYDQTQPEYEENKQEHDTTMYEKQNNEGIEQSQQQIDYEQDYVEEKRNENGDISPRVLEEVAENNS